MVVCHKRWEQKTENAGETGRNGTASFAEGGPVFLVRRPLSAHARALLAEASAPADARPALRLVG